MTSGRTTAREILTWKKSECVDCQLNCSRQVLEVSNCIEMDNLITLDTIPALAKRAVRFLCREKSYPGTIKSPNWPRTKNVVYVATNRNATLTCSDMKEYEQLCQR